MIVVTAQAKRRGGLDMASAIAGGDGKNVWKVARVVPENGDVNSLFLEGGDDRFKKRAAGQYASIRIPSSGGWTEPHPFTISAAPEDPLLCFTIKKEGPFTSAIPDLKPGTPVKVAGPVGAFCRAIEERPEIVMIAGGVGITPFLSVLRHFRNAGAKNRILLFWGNKTMSEAFRLDEIGAMTRELDLTVVHCLSREESVEGHFDERTPRMLYEKGRVSADILGRHGVKPGAACYLCGPPGMMEATLKELEALGVDPASVQEERFVWKK